MIRSAGILAFAAVVLTAAPGAAQTSLRFHGHGTGDIDRVKIRLDDPDLPSDPGPPADVGATDFTLEFFMKAESADNVQGGAVSCNASNIDWIYGNIVFDRDRYNQDRKFGISIADGVILFGMSGDGTGDYTICGTSDVLDGQWHHVALQRRRSDGRLDVYLDGVRENQADGPDGDVSYPDDGDPMSFCGAGGNEPCDDSDPFLVIAAEKHDAGSQFPSYAGLIDEVRLSGVLRYSGTSYTVPTQAFAPDADTLALYHFDAAAGSCSGTVTDSSGATGGPSDGDCQFGGSAPSGPVYVADSPFAANSIPAASGGARALLAFALAAAAIALGRRR